MLTVGDKFPQIELPACVSTESGKEFATISLQAHIEQGKWMVIFFWPYDFSSLCPTEIIGFNEKYEEFVERNALLYGASTDTATVHLAWRKYHDGLKNLKFPMLSDHAKKLCSQLGILTGRDEVAMRATFIVDPEGIIRWVSVNHIIVGRNIEEVLRTLDALQTNTLTPCNWKKGQPTL
ncbi:MAG: peroxiredoxin [Bacteroidia bacterium]|nr:peroxiredoxin [Bacteroidia bacterium]MDW8302139.1 peroxiredoxin [Bacteroidia bacterium]